MRLELFLLSLFLSCWAVVLLHIVGLVPMDGTLEIGLQGFYAMAVAAGWLSGNVYVNRSRGLPRELSRRLLLIYLLGPPGVLSLLRSMASVEAQMAAPIVPIYAGIAFCILFLVPVSLKGAFRKSPDGAD